MKSIVIGVSLALAVVGVLWAQNITKIDPPSPRAVSIAMAIDHGAKWLASAQGADGGWGQDGGETSYVRTAERLESTETTLQTRRSRRWPCSTPADSISPMWS